MRGKHEESHAARAVEEMAHDPLSWLQPLTGTEQNVLFDVLSHAGQRYAEASDSLTVAGKRSEFFSMQEAWRETIKLRVNLLAYGARDTEIETTFTE